MLLAKKIPYRYILKSVNYELIAVVFFNCIIISLKYYYQFSFQIPINVAAFLGTAITLVLSFKLSQSYDRWWEARKIWGAIVNDSRTLVLQLKAFCKDQTIVKSIALRQAAWNYTLTHHLRKLALPEKELSRLVNSEEFEAIKNAAHVPLKLMDTNVAELKEAHERGKINNFQQIQLDDTLVRLCESMGKAERIKNTVFPTTYVLFLRFFIFIFLATLVISLDKLNPMVEIVLVMAVALPFLLLQKTALYLQDPFENRPTDTPMTAISQAIEANIMMLLGEEVRVSVQKQSFYQL